ncbi:MAG: hypothetical protein WB676_26990 [Bryobacteraceae bacterium]
MAANGEGGDGKKKQAAYSTQNTPNRAQCPTPDLLEAVARRSLPFDHPAVQHVGLCEFCLEDLSRLRVVRKRRRVASITIGVVVIFAVAAGLFWSRQRHLSGSRAPTEMAVDLRPFEPKRGDIGNTPGGTPEVPRRNLKLSFALPVGMDPGQYEIRLMDEQLHVVQQSTGEAVIQDYEVHLLTQMDLSSLNAGEYRLWIRRPQQSWRDYPLQIR